MIIPLRYLFAILGCLGVIITFAFKSNMSMAIVSMVNHTAVGAQRNHTVRSILRVHYPYSAFGPMPNMSNNSIEIGHVKDGPMVWSNQQQGIILSSYFWGYLVGQIPGGIASQQFSPMWTFYAGVSAQIIGTFLIPLCTYLHYGFILAIRVLQGITAGFVFPAMHALLTRWTPLAERSIITSCVYSGSAIGIVLSLLLVGKISKDISWEASFYVTGSLAVSWMILWPIFITDTPKAHKLIKQKELDYILSSTRVSEKKRLKVPWGKIFKSGMFWLLTLTHTTTTWCWYMALTELPIYMNAVLKFKLDENGLAASLPFVAMVVCGVIYGKLADYLIDKNMMTITRVRKLSTMIASVGPAGCFAVIIFLSEEDKIKVVALMVLSMVFFSSTFSGILQMHMDIAPNFAGTLISLTNTSASIPGIAIPLFVGWITERDPSVRAWQIVFLITIGICLFQFAVFTIYAKSTELKWNTAQEPTETSTEGVNPNDDSSK